MITRADILVLGLRTAVIGGLVGGILLFAGMNLVMSHQNIGWLPMLLSGPVCGGIGYLFARNLANRAGLAAKTKR